MPNKSANIEHAANPPVPRFQNLYWFRYGWEGGKQVSLFLGYRGDGYVVRKWRANSGRWTYRLLIRKADLIGVVTATEAKRLGSMLASCDCFPVISNSTFT